MAGARAAYEGWFRAADKDHSGYLSQKEFKKTLKARGYKVNRKALKHQFKVIDMDGDHKISFQEYVILMSQLPVTCHREARMREAMRKADRNRDGYVDIREMNNLFRNMDLDVDEMVALARTLDQSGKGRIKYNDFLRLYARKQGIMKDSDSDSSDSD